MICISLYYLSLHNFLNKMSFIACNFLLSGNHVKKKEFTRVCERMEAKLELKRSKRTILKCLRRCSWSAWVVYHVWKLQIRKEIKEAKSKKEKSDLSTDQYFWCISLLKNPIDTRLDGGNCDLNIYNFLVLSFSKFSIFEGRN